MSVDWSETTHQCRGLSDSVRAARTHCWSPRSPSSCRARARHSRAPRTTRPRSSSRIGTRRSSCSRPSRGLRQRRRAVRPGPGLGRARQSRRAVAARPVQGSVRIRSGGQGSDREPGRRPRQDLLPRLPGDPLHAGCTYEEASRELMQGKSPTVYAHVLGEPGVNGVALQYWFFWYFNQFNDVHEGDWEMIQIAWDGTSSVDDGARPGTGSHRAGTARRWRAREPGARPSCSATATTPRSTRPRGRTRPTTTTRSGSAPARTAPGFGCDDSTAPSRRVAVDTVVVPNGDVRSGPVRLALLRGQVGTVRARAQQRPRRARAAWPVARAVPLDGGLRTSSPTVPLGSSFGPSVTGVFCGVIATGSIAYNSSPATPE